MVHFCPMRNQPEGETTLLTRRQIEAKFQLSRSAIYQMMSQGRFPRPLRLGKKCVRWRAQDIEHYIESLPVSTGEASEEKVST